MPWRCFVVEESPFCRRSLRRYADGPCPLTTWIHDATAVIDPRLEGGTEGGFLKGDFSGDPRWPAACACGRTFTEEDHWQVHVDRLYRGFPDGTLRCLRDRGTPPGAMWLAPWLADGSDRYSGPDGKAWCVMLPGGTEWVVYSYASGPEPRKKWDVSGAPPDITVHPSINLTGVYHGHIVAGVVSEDTEGRTFAGIPRTA
jgi:hypothetical protein